MTTRQETKKAMLTDAQKLKAANILKRMGIKEINTTVNNLEAKYGPYAYDIVVKSAMAPADVAKQSGKSIKTSAQAVRYFETNSLDAGTLEKILGKKVDKSKLNNKAPAGRSSSQSKQAKMSTRVATRTAKKSTPQAKRTTAPARPQSAFPTPFKPLGLKETLTQQNPWPQKTWLDKNPEALIPPYKRNTPENTYANVDPMNTGTVRMEDLMKKAGVTPADLQAVLAKSPANVSKLKAGQMGTKIARRADKVSGKLEGGCLGGVQTIIAGAGLGFNIDGNDPDWPKKEPKANSNSGCNTYKILDKKGFYTISVPMDNCMAYIENAPKGTVLSFDNCAADVAAGRKSGASATHGHTAVCTSTKGVYACDGKQTRFNLDRYGQNAHLTFAPDTTMSKDMAMQLIAEAQRRKARELAAQQKNNGR